ncbi:MAG: hypothetical protein HQL63_04395 [Magnetococcales bacterium]|nr:hypothetical protein [Magnetococcales bacterium]MBF0321744.1 hypothetical protein [Magnetococcales bacterium]
MLCGFVTSFRRVRDLVWIGSLLTVLVQGGTVAWAGESHDNHEVLCRMEPTCHVTLLARLPHAPFPYDGPSGDTEQPFFDHTDPVTGQRVHTVDSGMAYPESLHYQDNRVLIHLPPAFRPDAPFEILVFFHGHHTEIVRTLVEEMALLQQLDAANRNAVLVAPQMALNAADSSPGKLYLPRGFSNMLKDVARVLGREVDKRFAARFKRAPVILAAFSGGYRAVAYTLDRGFSGPGERDKRLRGVILLDALYGEPDKFADWLWHGRRRGFFVNLYGPSSESLARRLEQDLTEQKQTWHDTLKRRIKSKGIYSLAVETPHETIFLDGPPHWPLAEILGKVGGHAALRTGAR